MKLLAEYLAATVAISSNIKLVYNLGYYFFLLN